MSDSTPSFASDLSLNLPSPSLERFYPMPCPELGFGKSDIKAADVGRHYARYRDVEKMLLDSIEFSGDRPVLADVGCGSGYGTNYLRVGLKDMTVYGVDPCELSRRYAQIHFPEIQVFNDIPDNLPPDVVVMVEAVEHMTVGEMVTYLEDARVAVITTPLVDEPNNEFHEQSFKTREDVQNHLLYAGFIPVREKVERGITFTTGERGAQYIGVFRWSKDAPKPKKKDDGPKWEDSD